MKRREYSILSTLHPPAEHGRQLCRVYILLPCAETPICINFAIVNLLTAAPYVYFNTLQRAYHKLPNGAMHDTLSRQPLKRFTSIHSVQIGQFKRRTESLQGTADRTTYYCRSIFGDKRWPRTNLAPCFMSLYTRAMLEP